MCQKRLWNGSTICCHLYKKKEISKGVKRQVKKRLKQSEKIKLIKIKKIGYLCVAGDFLLCMTYFRSFLHAIVACMKVPFLGKKFTYFLYVFVRFCPYSFLFYRFLKKCNSGLHDLAYELQFYNCFHILYNLVPLYLHA